MGLFGPSKSDLADRIETLESQIDDLADTAERARREAQSAKEQALHESRKRKELVDVLNDLFGPDHVQTEGRVSDLSGVVETLDNAHIGYKATRNAIVELVFPAGTRIVHPDYAKFPSKARKRRAEHAIVSALYDPTDIHHVVNSKHDKVEIGNVETGPVGPGDKFPKLKQRPDSEDLDDATCSRLVDTSLYDGSFEYRIGEVVEPDDELDTTLRKDCASGIHFFRTLEGALEWYEKH